MICKAAIISCVGRFFLISQHDQGCSKHLTPNCKDVKCKFYCSRCVQNDQTSLAVGTQWMIVRLGGMVPGPILFGLLLDDACTHWLRTCDANGEGSCFMYDHYLISR